MTAAVVGGGIAGLTAAYELVKAGERPFLIEPGTLGGMIRSSTLSGFTLEAGPNVLVERPDIAELINDLGLRSDVCYPAVQPYGQYVWYRGRPVKVPTGVCSLVTSPLFSIWAKLALPYRVLAPGTLPGKAEDASVEDFFAPLIGRHAVKHLLDPVLKGIYGGEVRELSARSLFPGLWSAAHEGLSVMSYMRGRPVKGKPPIMVIRGGIQRLSDRLWDSIKTHVELISSSVRRIVPLEGTRFRISLADGRQFEVDGCIITAAGPQAAPLVAGVDESLADMLQAIRYAGLTAIHLSVPRSETLLPDAFGVLFPGGMPLHLLGAMFNSLIFPHVAPADKHVVTLMVGGAQASGEEVSEEELQRKIPQVLTDLLHISRVEWLAMTRWPAAIPQLTLGHYKVIEAMDACEHDFPGVVFAGVDRGGVGVSDRIRIAREAVRRLRRVRVETVV